MKKVIFSLGLLAINASAQAISDENFNKCVVFKDITQMIVDQANSGMTRSALKARVDADGLNPSIDFVYDFRGAMSDQEIVAKQMESCLRRFDKSSKKK